MNYKDLLTIIFSSSVTSAVITTLLSPVVELIKSKCEQNKINSERKYNEEKEKKQKLAKIYLDAISLVELIRYGFFDTRGKQSINMKFNFFVRAEQIKDVNEVIIKMNDLIKITVPMMRLFATDEIFKLYLKLIGYSKYSYSENIISQSLLEAFDEEFSHICKAMQKDLG